jgi:hypothetical protein
VYQGEPNPLAHNVVRAPPHSDILMQPNAARCANTIPTDMRGELRNSLTTWFPYTVACTEAITGGT